MSFFHESTVVLSEDGLAVEQGSIEIDTLMAMPAGLVAAENVAIQLEEQLDALASREHEPVLEIQLLDPFGVVMTTGHAVLAQAWDTTNRSAVFSVLMPAASLQGVSRARAHVPGTANEATRDASQHAPTITVHSPNGGAFAPNQMAPISWTAADADNDEMTFSIQYSNDDGENWILLDDEVSSSSYLQPASSLPGTTGSSGRIRVLANDGFHTVAGMSGGFEVAGKAPSASIATPRGAYPLGQVIIGRGSAHDLEDLVIPPEQLSWTVNGEPAGTGRQIFIDTALLGLGTHYLELAAVDSDNNVGRSVVAFVITEAGIDSNEPPPGSAGELYEPFAHPLHGDLPGNTAPGGQTWLAAGPGGPGPGMRAESLFHENLVGGMGNHIAVRAIAGSGARLPLGTNVASGRLYYSLLLRVEDLTGLGAAGATILGFDAVSNATLFPPAALAGRLFVRSAGDGYNLGLSKTAPNPALASWDPRVFSPGETLFVVVAYDWILNRASLWVFEDGAGPAGELPPSPSMVSTAGSASPGIAAFSLVQSATNSLPAVVLVDELRTGPLWTHVVKLARMDFGDAPSPPYPTLLPGGARHRLSALYLGAGVDAESNGQPVDWDGADESGVGIPPMIIGSNVVLAITASSTGLLSAWLDSDGTPGFSPAEQVFTNRPVAAGTHAYALAIPPSAVAGTTWFRFRLSSAGGLSPGGLASDGEVEDYRVNLLRPVNPRPILFVLDYHADPMSGPVSTQATTFSNWVSASHWLLDQTEPRGAKVSFLTVGGFAEWARAVPDLGYPLLQRLHASGAQLGTHSHSDYRAGPHNWLNLPPAPSLLQLTNAWNDHLDMVDALVAESLGFTAIADIRRINFVRGGAPTDDQVRLDFMAMSGYTQHEQGPDEQFYAYFAHYPMNPYRPRGANFLEHDPTGPVVLAPFGSVLGANAIHYNILQDMRPPAVKARMLLEVLNWLHDRKVAGTERIWVSGWGQHCSDVEPGGISRPHVIPMLDWLNEHFIGQPVGGAVAANWASMGEAGEAYRQWETTHSGATSFSYAPTNRDWNQYQYLRPAAAYLASALYLSNMPAIGPVRWHAVTARPEGLPPFTAYVAYTTNGVPVAADLSAHLPEATVAMVNSASGFATSVPSTAVPIPATGVILVPTNRLVQLRFDFGDAPSGYPVRLAENGARHMPSSLSLGFEMDTEWDGRPGANADGDDLATALDDEDGVILPDGLVAGRTNLVIVRMTGSAEATLDVWFDWNRDLDWYDAGEYFRLSVVSGTNLWPLAVPATASYGQTFVRFRLSTDGTPWPTNAAPDGEVEDYRVEILPPPAEVVWVRNPTSGVDLYCHIHRPATFDPGEVYPGIVLVPGGVADGSSFDEGHRAQRYADLGFIVMHFDPDGRGNSTASGIYTNENYCGHLHQDGLRAVLQHLKGLPVTDDLNLGIVSSSFGITMASGVLARYPDDPLVKFLMDWEGPADRTDTAKPRGHVPYDPSEDALWSEREAAGFISSFAGYYLRVQTERDHVQTNNNHAIQLLNLATDIPHGGSGRCLWTRVNSATGPAGNPTNIAYSDTSPPNWIAEGIPTDPLMEDYLLELSAMPPLRLDFGNAPPPYPTTLAHSGARHNFAAGWRLGTLLDWEVFGPDAPPADEDGVVSPAALIAGSDAAFQIVASTSGRLDAFLDWNRDGDWDDPGERVTLSGGTPLVTGLNVLIVTVPETSIGTTWARFRFSDGGGLGPTGSAAKGEVEDYAIFLMKPITLSTSFTDGSVQLHWDGAGGAVLEQAETLRGPWNKIPDATIPYVVGPTGAQGFFRVRMILP